MDKFNFSLYRLALEGGEVICGSFDPVAYSRFKYGFTPPGICYGKQLADLIWPRLESVLDSGEPILIVSAPYRHLPTASHVIANSLCHELGRRAIDCEAEPPVLVPFHKRQVGDSTYAKSSKDDRLKTLATLGLHIDEGLIPGSHILVVDDIRITGAAEEATAAYLEPLGPGSIWYLHAASFDRELAISNPEIEDKLNQTIPHTLEDILRQDVSRVFQLNTRVLRHILESPLPFEFDFFLSYAAKSLLEEILRASVGSGLTYYRKHSRAIALVAKELENRSSER